MYISRKALHAAKVPGFGCGQSRGEIATILGRFPVLLGDY